RIGLYTRSPGMRSRPRSEARHRSPRRHHMTADNPYAFRFQPGMRQGLRTEIPLPTRLVSNEEFPALPQTPAQRAVENRILAEAGHLASRLGLSRRDFLRRSGGVATPPPALEPGFGRFFRGPPLGGRPASAV